MLIMKLLDLNSKTKSIEQLLNNQVKKKYDFLTNSLVLKKKSIFAPLFTLLIIKSLNLKL
ncbi:MAG: hypothetical protein BWX63_01809 [Bacteroidetes bacterium ADurb.Bin041]|nr:MAG: hypothetical protein BWX63_01809 [Bacteroidetes bacterium ADurb.Bin041]